MSNGILVAFISEKLKTEFESLESGKLRISSFMLLLTVQLKTLRPIHNAESEFLRNYGQRNIYGNLV